jgi:hypothetical protein
MYKSKNFQFIQKIKIKPLSDFTYKIAAHCRAVWVFVVVTFQRSSSTYCIN